jgi:hypothetical protein
VPSSRKGKFIAFSYFGAGSSIELNQWFAVRRSDWRVEHLRIIRGRKGKTREHRHFGLR